MFFLFKKLFDKSFKKFELSKMSFKSLNKSEIISLYNRSNIILDINHPNQTGLTMRTIECIGAKRKMITTNTDVENYSFYNSKNIYILDRKDMIIDENFLITEYQDIDSDTYNLLSIGGWLYSIFIDDAIKEWRKI